METNLPGNFHELITNPYFIEWVKNPTPESDQFWQLFLQKNSSIKEEFEKARYVVKKLQRQNKVIDEDNVREIWINIQSKLQQNPGRTKLLIMWEVAATIVLIVGLASIFYFKFGKKDIDYSKIAVVDANTSAVTLILSDGQEKVFNGQEPSFSYTEHGTIEVDSALVLKESTVDSKEHKQKFNQLVIPYGKRSKLFLSDGTKVILNSGSRIIYPVNFPGGKREVYLEGEAYLKVAHNPKSPFYVKTNEMALKVLGTEFNVNTYKEDDNSSVVLVNGCVEAHINKEKILLEKNERLTINKSFNKIEKEVVDVREYISWKDGWMYCNNESIDEIATKLSRYYNLDISFQDKQAQKLTMTGKLDLRSDYREVLDVICFSAPIQYSELNDEVIFKLK